MCDRGAFLVIELFHFVRELGGSDLGSFLIVEGTIITIIGFIAKYCSFLHFVDVLVAFQSPHFTTYSFTFRFTFVSLEYIT